MYWTMQYSLFLAVLSIPAMAGVSAAGTASPIPIHANSDVGITTGLVDAKLDEVGGVFFVGTGFGSPQAAVVHVDGQGRRQWNWAPEVEPNGLAVGRDGIYVVGHRLHEVEDRGGRIRNLPAPAMAKLSREGTLMWSKDIDIGQTPTKAHASSPFNLEPPGSAELWDAVAMPNGGALVLGRAKFEQGPRVVLLSVDAEGTLRWKRLIPAATDWLYFGPSKVRPLLSLHDRALYIAGAYTEPGSHAELTVWKVDPETGEVQASFHGEGSMKFTAAALEPSSGRIAITYAESQGPSPGSHVIVLDASLATLTDLSVRESAWYAQIAWDNPNRLFVPFEHKVREFVSNPAVMSIELREGRAKVVQRWEFRDEWYRSGLAVGVIKGVPYLAYSRAKDGLAGAPPPGAQSFAVGAEELVVRRLDSSKSKPFVFHAREDGQFGKPMRWVPDLQGHLLLSTCRSHSQPIFLWFDERK